jgi:hypothetical protein
MYDVDYKTSGSSEMYHGNVTKTYDATSYSGAWAAMFGSGWKGFWLKGDVASTGIEDIQVDVVGGTGVFADFGSVNENNALTVDDTGTYLFGPDNIAVTFTSITGADTVSLVANDNTFPPDFGGGKPVKRYFQIYNGPGLTGFQAVLTLPYLQAEFDSSDILYESSLYCARYDGGAWVPYISTVDTVNNTVTCTTSQFSLWGIGGDNGALAVALSSYTISVEPAGVGLAWSTSSEQGNLGWNILRSHAADGPWAQVNPTLIPGAGTSTAPHSYAYYDGSVPAGRYYYQLEQVDVNGSREYSQALAVTVGTVAVADGAAADYTPEIHIGNPASCLTVTLRSAGQGHAVVALHTLSGKKIGVLYRGPLTAGTYQFTLREQVRPGLYLVTVEGERHSHVFKVLLIE